MPRDDNRQLLPIWQCYWTSIKNLSCLKFGFPINRANRLSIKPLLALTFTAQILSTCFQRKTNNNCNSRTFLRQLHCLLIWALINFLVQRPTNKTIMKIGSTSIKAVQRSSIGLSAWGNRANIPVVGSRLARVFWKMHDGVVVKV